MQVEHEPSTEAHLSKIDAQMPKIEQKEKVKEQREDDKDLVTTALQEQEGLSGHVALLAPRCS